VRCRAGSGGQWRPCGYSPGQSATGRSGPGRSGGEIAAGHARELRDALARYVDAARRVASTARRGRRGSAGDLNALKVRKWAEAQGIEVKDRGRVPADLIVKFRAATS
jgi:hypothetical protein